MINIQQGMSPQLYKSMHGLNNLFNNNVQLQRLDDINNIGNINNNVQLQYYNLIDIHQVNSTYAVHIIAHQHINIQVIIHHLIATS